MVTGTPARSASSRWVRPALSRASCSSADDGDGSRGASSSDCVITRSYDSRARRGQDASRTAAVPAMTDKMNTKQFGATPTDTTCPWGGSNSTTRHSCLLDFGVHIGTSAMAAGIGTEVFGASLLSCLNEPGYCAGEPVGDVRRL